jgi:hypothetical protein
MMEIGLRFERTGRAAIVGRWELAAYDVDELEEVFRGDLIPSSWTEHAGVARLAHDFVTATLPALHSAVQRRDRQALEDAFTATARACNACHVAAGMSFIEISETIGQRAPVLTGPADARP